MKRLPFTIDYQDGDGHTITATFKPENRWTRLIRFLHRVF